MKIKRVRILSARSWQAELLMCLAGCVAASGATARTLADQASCGPAAAHTIAADATARIYRVLIGHSFTGPQFAYYGCAVAHTTPALLSSTDAQSWVRMVELRGVMAGFIVDQNGVDTGSNTLVVRDLTDGRVLHTASVSWMAPRTSNSLDTYVLAPSGNVAWASEHATGPTIRNEVTIRRAIGRTVRTLDRGGSIRPGSLRLLGHSIQWIDGGLRRHAPLP
ncbi:MAG: hypothetical protein ACR2L9_12280 [Solirubrobacteraceae bacterium]|nr:hypothetical protein [Actinomycetota bacterium]